MGLFSRDKPKIKIQTTRKDGFSGWLKCTHCLELIHTRELEENFNCCPKCDYHYRVPAAQRIAMIADPETFQELFSHFRSGDPLQFVDSQTYGDRLDQAEKQSGHSEAIITGTCQLEGTPIALAVLDFQFMAGSMGSVVGERLTSLIELATQQGLPLIIVSTSGGARMQESILSLMQMAKTSAALSRLHLAGVPYVSVLTNPTTGGVTASFASLGDVIIAEPKALICFAGPRVVEQTIREKLPPEAQKSEFLLHHGMIDCIIRRPLLRQKLVEVVNFLTDNERDYLGQDETELPQQLRELLAYDD